MRAVRIEAYGGPEVLILDDVPVPSPEPGQVLVRIHYSGINFMDIHTRQGKYARSTTYPVRLPTYLGMEGAGIVEAVGDNVRGFKPGDRVAYCLSWGSYAEFAVVDEDKLAHVPLALPLEAAASAMFHGLTAHYLAYDTGALRPGMTCLVHASSGGIGQLLVQLGNMLGAQVFATASTGEKLEIARRRGAHHVFTYDDGKFADRVRELTDGRGVDVVFDPIGKPTFRDTLRATRKKGLVISFGSVGGSVSDMDPIELGEAGSLFLTRPRLADHLQDGATVRKRAGDIFGAMADGRLTIETSRMYTLDNVDEAHRGLEARQTVGKPILKLI